MEEDIRGFDLRVDNFQTQLTSLINEANLPISTVYYILKDYCVQAQTLFTQESNKQYKAFCEEAYKEQQNQKAEEEQNSSSSND